MSQNTIQTYLRSAGLLGRPTSIVVGQPNDMGICTWQCCYENVDVWL